MTLVHFFETVPTASGTNAPAKGHLQFKPTAARVITGTPDEEVLPSPFEVALDEFGKASVTLAQTGASWCWRVNLHGPNAWPLPVYVAVGSGVSADFPDLTEVDPTTLAPAAEPEAAWWALWNAMAAGTYLVPDPINVGLYIPTEANPMTQDPANAGLYTIGAPV